MIERVPSTRDTRRRAVAALVGSVLLVASIAACAASGPATGPDASVSMAVRTGTVIDGHAIERRLPPASLARLMTAHPVFEAIEAGRIDAGDRLRVDAREWRMSGSQMVLEVDERVTIDKLLRGMIVAGSNDAAHGPARHPGPGGAQYVARMNRTARALGMTDTHFVNPGGLPAPTQRPPARDLAALARALVREFPGQQARLTEPRITHGGRR